MDENNECIICLENIDEKKSYLNFPISNGCNCKYLIHYECFYKCNFNCPICSKKLNQLNYNDIIGENKNKEIYSLLSEIGKKEIVKISDINYQISEELITDNLENNNYQRCCLRSKKIFIVSLFILFIFLFITLIFLHFFI